MCLSTCPPPTGETEKKQGQKIEKAENNRNQLPPENNSLDIEK